ncbi:MAG: sigma-E processing peptidase SpoIIGA [Clostridia bacterium]|nr:sigma-E processing peptidase SpoIIGA [Clostridia bacterium]
MNVLMLALAVRLGGGRFRPGRVIAGALAGTWIASGARALALSRMEAACLWLPAAIIMMGIAGGRKALRTPVKSALLLMCAAGLVGGMVLSFSGVTGSLAGAYVLGAAAALAAGACTARARCAAQDMHCARVTCAYRGRQATFDAIIDSGNTLRDYLTHLPVIVIDEKSARQALAIGDMRFRPIFAQTAGGRVRMDVFVPQEIVLEADGKRITVRAAVALCDRLGENVPALVPAALLLCTD